jgi:Zn-dependent protease
VNESLLGLIWYAVLLFSLTFHEAAHAYAAKRGGDPTAYLGGQVSLDPRPHVRREPFGMVMVPLLSFALSHWMIGWASTPYDPRWAERHPRRAAWMSLAGPAANLALVILAGALIRIGISAGVLRAPEIIHFTQVVAPSAEGPGLALAILLSILFTLNLLLCVFNLIPLPPLDGAGAVALLAGGAASLRFQHALRHPRFSLIGLIVAWMVIGRLFGPIHRLAVSCLYPELRYG